MSGHAWIGLDFGSYLTKVAFRVVDVGNTAAQSLDVVGVSAEPWNYNGNWATEFPSRVWTNGREIAFVPTVGVGWTEVSGIKLGLLNAWDGNPDPDPLVGLSFERIATLIIARTLCHTMAAIKQFTVERRWACPDNYFVSCATPSSGLLSEVNRSVLEDPNCPRRVQMRNLVESARKFVCDGRFNWNADRLWLPAAERLTKQIILGEQELDPANMRTFCYPEAYAAVLASVLHPAFDRDALLMVFDIGALTTDAALFFFNPKVARTICFHTIGSTQSGIGPLFLLDQVDGVALARLHSDLSKFYCKIWEDIYRHVPQGRTPDIFEARRHNQPKWKCLLLGGGSANLEVRKLVMELRIPSLRNGGDDRIIPVARMRFLESPMKPFGWIAFPSQVSTHYCIQTGARVYPPGRERKIQDQMNSRLHLNQLAIGLTSDWATIPEYCEIQPPVIQVDRPDHDYNDNFAGPEVM